MSDVGLALRQVRFTNKAFWRNPASAFFTFAFPLMFLVIFTSLLGSGRVEVSPGVFIDQASYYVAAMTTFAVITACYTNIAMSISFQRDNGVLKRTRGTPLPGWAYLLGRVLHAILVAILLVALTTAFGVAFYNASVPTGALLGEFVTVLVVGAASFAALGLATTAIVPNADAAPAVVNAIILPLLFLSGVFIPIEATAPAWIRWVGKAFPVRHFADAMIAAFYGHPFTFEWSDVLVVAAWGIAGLALAARFFSWEPRR
ncbi:MAG: ABC transporter permease [Actinomycetota bacterium]